jgi:hypothetical protein
LGGGGRGWGVGVVGAALGGTAQQALYSILSK